MKTNKRIADALESIASSLRQTEGDIRNIRNMYTELLGYNANTNYSYTAITYFQLVSIFGEELASRYIRAVELQDFKTANEIIASLSAPKIGRKPKQKDEVKPEPKKRGRKPKNTKEA